MSNIFVELKRRKVIRVAIAYLVVMFIALQVIDLLIPSTTLPPWADELLLAIAILGFPIAIIAAWALELTPDGIRLTQPAESGTGKSSATPSYPMITAIVITLVLGLTGYWYLQDQAEPGESGGGLVIAVLPFTTLGSVGASTFTEGIHLGVLTRLSNVSGIDVISRTSVMAYQSSEKRLPQIASELGAEWALRADVQELNGQVQVNARLVNARLDRQIWAKQYRRSLDAQNIFDIQAELSRSIIEALEMQLTPSEGQRIDFVPTENLEAFQVQLMGRRELDKRTAISMRMAADLFRQAVELDENYALAWVGLADALSLLYDYGFDLNPELLDRANTAVNRAIELNNQSAAAHASKGLLLFARRQGADAITELTEATRLAPSYADAFSWLSWAQQILGNPEAALEAGRRAATLDPLSGEPISNLALANLSAGNYQQALRDAEHTLEVLPKWPTGRFYEGLARYHLGQYEKATGNLKDLEVEWAASGAAAAHAVALVAADDSDAAESILAKVGTTDDVFSSALILASLGSHDAALVKLEKIDNWSAWPTLAMRYYYPDVFGPIRADPRYSKIIQKINVSWKVSN